MRALAAANQKTAREPVMALELTDVRRALGTLRAEGPGPAGFRLPRRALRASAGAAILADPGADRAARAADAARPADRPRTAGAQRAHGAVPVGRGGAQQSRPLDRPQAGAGAADRARSGPARGALRASARRAGSGGRAAAPAPVRRGSMARTSRRASRRWSDRWRSWPRRRTARRREMADGRLARVTAPRTRTP